MSHWEEDVSGKIVGKAIYLKFVLKFFRFSNTNDSDAIFSRAMFDVVSKSFRTGHLELEL